MKFGCEVVPQSFGFRVKRDSVFNTTLKYTGRVSLKKPYTYREKMINDKKLFQTSCLAEYCLMQIESNIETTL